MKKNSANDRKSTTSLKSMQVLRNSSPPKLSSIQKRHFIPITVRTMAMS